MAKVGIKENGGRGIWPMYTHAAPWIGIQWMKRLKWKCAIWPAPPRDSPNITREKHVLFDWSIGYTYGTLVLNTTHQPCNHHPQQMSFSLCFLRRYVCPFVVEGPRRVINIDNLCACVKMSVLSNVGLPVLWVNIDLCTNWSTPMQYPWRSEGALLLPRFLECEFSLQPQGANEPCSVSSVWIICLGLFCFVLFCQNELNPYSKRTTRLKLTPWHITSVTYAFCPLPIRLHITLYPWTLSMNYWPTSSLSLYIYIYISIAPLHPLLSLPQMLTSIHINLCSSLPMPGQRSLNIVIYSDCLLLVRSSVAWTLRRVKIHIHTLSWYHPTRSIHPFPLACNITVVLYCCFSFTLSNL